MGGISVLFTEIISRLPPTAYELVCHGATAPPGLVDRPHSSLRPRRFERYRRARFGGSAAIFHSTYYRLPAARGPKVVTTVYDFVYERFASLPRRLVHGVQKQAALAGSDRIICISENTRRDLIEFGGERYRARSVVVPLAAAAAFRPVAGVTRQPQVLFVGARGGYKNFTALVHALAPLREVSLLCVGGGELTSDERAHLERNLPGRYRSAGFLTNDELNLEYNRSLCLAYPSLYEGFGIPVLEAMRAGCPVIAVAASAIPEVAGDAALLLQRGDPDEIRRAIESVAQADTRASLVARGAARSAGFSWDETFRRTLGVYEDLLGRPITVSR